jgi:hypothetical protein
MLYFSLLPVIEIDHSLSFVCKNDSRGKVLIILYTAFTEVFVELTDFLHFPKHLLVLITLEILCRISIQGFMPVLSHMTFSALI